MKFNGGAKSTLVPIIAVAGLAVLTIPFLVRRGEVETPTNTSPPEAPLQKPADVVPPPPMPATRPVHPDVLLRKWQTSIAQKDQQGVVAAQAAFLEREGEYRGPLMTMSKEDPDPRIRAFSVAVLGRMKTPPSEQFFIDRLVDVSDYPRSSALEALRKLGTSACLPVVEGLAEAGPQDLRAAAAETAKAVRSR